MPSEGPNYQEDTDRLPTDDVFEILSATRRRRAIALVDRRGGRDIQTLAEHIAAVESGHPVGRVPDDAHKRVYVSLYQCHLPKCDDAGVLIHDSDSGRVEHGPHLDTVAWYLDNGPASESDAIFETLRTWLSRKTGAKAD